MTPMQQLWGRIFALEAATRAASPSVPSTPQGDDPARSPAVPAHLRPLLPLTRAATSSACCWACTGASLLSRAKVTRMGLGKYRVPHSALLLLCDLGCCTVASSNPVPAADGVELAFGNQRWRLRQRQSNPHPALLPLTPIGNELALLLDEPPEEYLQDRRPCSPPTCR